MKALGELEIVPDRLKQPELSICYENVQDKLEKLVQLSVDEFSGQDEEFWTEYPRRFSRSPDLLSRILRLSPIPTLIRPL